MENLGRCWEHFRKALRKELEDRVKDPIAVAGVLSLSKKFWLNMDQDMKYQFMLCYGNPAKTGQVAIIMTVSIDMMLKIFNENRQSLHEKIISMTAFTRGQAIDLTVKSTKKTCRHQHPFLKPSNATDVELVDLTDD